MDDFEDMATFEEYEGWDMTRDVDSL